MYDAVSGEWLKIFMADVNNYKSIIIYFKELACQFINSGYAQFPEQLFCSTKNYNCSIPIISIKLIKMFQTIDGIQWITFALYRIMQNDCFLQEVKTDGIIRTKMWIIKFECLLTALGCPTCSQERIDELV